VSRKGIGSRSWRAEERGSAAPATYTTEAGRVGDDMIYGRYVLVASAGGAKRHPDWYLNLLEDPAVQVQLGDDRFAARARDARADERPALWKLMTSIGLELEDHQRKSGREIPVVILERI
jgi:deazaflavin-dependent oxidoreductase (nitroreductase family)